MRRPDLHLHTTASDGQFDVWQVARLVARADVTLFAITDHDTLDALPAAADAAYERGLAFLPGVEISTEGDEEVHILGYGVRYDDPVLNAFFRDMQEQRVSRVLAGRRAPVRPEPQKRVRPEGPGREDRGARQGMGGGRVRPPVLFGVHGVAHSDQDPVEIPVLRPVYPVFHHDQARPGGQRQVDLSMQVPEYEAVDMCALREIKRPLV